MSDPMPMLTDARRAEEYGKKIDEQAALIAALVAENERLVDALMWCSAASDFQQDGMAREGWLEVCKPLIDAAIAPAPAPAAADPASVYAWLGFWRDHMPPEAVEQLQRILARAPAPAVPPMSHRIAAATSIAMMARKWYGEPAPSTTHLPVNVIAKRLARFYPDAPAPAPEECKHDFSLRLLKGKLICGYCGAPAPAPEVLYTEGEEHERFLQQLRKGEP